MQLLMRDCAISMASQLTPAVTCENSGKIKLNSAKTCDGDVVVSTPKTVCNSFLLNELVFMNACQSW